MPISLNNLQPYHLQVAGSTPLLKTVDGNVAKPVCPNELAFYEKVLKKAPKLAQFVPKFAGRVAIEPEVVNQASQDALKDDEDNMFDEKEECELPERKRRNSAVEATTKIIRKTLDDWSYRKLVKKMSKRKCKIVREKSLSEAEEDSLVYIVIEDVAGRCKQPSILDLKVGTQQHSPSEPEKKRMSKSAKCKNSTSSTLGLRLSGMRIFKSDGKEDFRDKYYGRGLTDSKFKDMIRHFVTCRSKSCNQHIRTSVVKKLVKQVEELVAAIKETEIRFYGCSCLIVFPSFSDNEGAVQPQLKLIDFANAEVDSHNSSYDEGFVFGLENLKQILLDLE